MKDRIYLDHNATTPTDKRVLEAMLPYFSDNFGNASSLHRFGQRAHVALEDARAQVASILGAGEKEIVFTSGGSESDNFAVKGTAYSHQDKGRHIVTSAIEHPAVLNTCEHLQERGFDVTFISVDERGVVDLNELEDAIRKDTILVTIMYANNEVGTIQPIAEISKMVKKRGILFHTDAVQAVGKLEMDVNRLGVDMLSVSAHKLYGPKGVGALYIRSGVEITPLIHGGHHEKGRRASTENLPGVVGLGKACEICMSEMKEESKRLTTLRERLWEGLNSRISDTTLLGHPTKRLPGTLAVAFKYVEGESVLLNLDLEGIAVSSGSACTSGSIEPSHVLLAMSVPPELARGGIRLSLGRGNTEEQIDRVIDVTPGIIEKLRAMSPLTKK
ncbi:cysteine desulfurase [candidate division TA06 bacterium DG_26]|uniref:Cysteine desulfurase IscS n=1 Tax=candidate division TA06 bacterium DG_26 TaxID=1703771 RepID=A0A0S7WEP5_UNCT6|nr:MAG: cysteine desulfurase [candidate division TA06 bacterium DG_26]